MSRRVTRAMVRPRMVQRQRHAEPAQVGWCRPPLRARHWCPRCWADLSLLVIVDWCPTCRRTLKMDRQS
jgi:hypothetical protein